MILEQNQQSFLNEVIPQSQNTQFNPNQAQQRGLCASARLTIRPVSRMLLENQFVSNDEFRAAPMGNTFTSRPSARIEFSQK
jgi:hypothetical protein